MSFILAPIFVMLISVPIFGFIIEIVRSSEDGFPHRLQQKEECRVWANKQWKRLIIGSLLLGEGMAVAEVIQNA